jgi:ABC-type dipeptide/oligopeptide/nickel transport system permease component
MQRGILHFILRRALQAIPLIVCIIALNFTLIHVAPGDPIDLIVKEGANETMIKMLRQEFGLDKPFHIQLLSYIRSVFTGNLGYSFTYQVPVLNLILERIPATLLLMFTALFFASFFGIALGVIASTRPFSLTDNFVAFVSLAGYSMPVFWLGQILIILLSLHFDIFPTGGMISMRETYTGFAKVLDVAKHMVLPALCYSMFNFALICRITRTSMLEVLRKDYVTTARSKGLAEKVVVLKHMLRNALIPVVTLIGMSLGMMFAGSVLTETVFSWPGLGRLTYDSIFNRDYPVLMGIFIFVSVAIIIANLLTDLVYSLLDPRIRYD